jgi:transposase
MKIALSAEEKEKLEICHNHEANGKARDRIKSILLRDEGWSLKKIAQALRLHNDTVGRYLSDYINGKKVKANHHGSQEKLNKDQALALVAHIKQNLYDKASSIIHYVKETYGVSYTIAGMTNWLKRHNFSYKQPKQQPAKADPDKQSKFIDEYQHLKANTPKNQPILFMDAVHPTMATKTSAGWIGRGEDKIVHSTASRTRMNIAGTVELGTMKVIAEDYETINSTTMIEFLNTVKSEYQHAPKIHIILDQSGYHRSADLKNYAKENNFELHFLPPYSPNLNPIERLWKVMNESVRNNYFFKSAQEFRARIRGFFKNILPDITPLLFSVWSENQLFIAN